MTAKRKTTVYAPALKLEAVRAFLDEGLSRNEVIERYNIASVSTFKKWVIAYRREGAIAFAPKPQGRKPYKPWQPLLVEPEDTALVHAEVQRLKRKLKA